MHIPIVTARRDVARVGAKCDLPDHVTGVLEPPQMEQRLPLERVHQRVRRGRRGVVERVRALEKQELTIRGKLNRNDEGRKEGRKEEMREGRKAETISVRGCVCRCCV